MGLGWVGGKGGKGEGAECLYNFFKCKLLGLSLATY